MSAGMCSSTSAATIRSNSPSANGSDSASPSLTSASAPAGTSPASCIATNRSRTPASSSASWSKAITSAPRRYISKAWRPAPQPMSSTRSPGRSPRRSKSTVSTGVPLSITSSSYAAAVAAATARQLKSSCTRRAAGRVPSRVAALGVVEQRGDRGASSPTSPGSTRSAQSPSGPTTSGIAPARDDHQRGLAGHQLGGRQREALVERGHAGQLGRAHHLDELGVADAVDEADGVARSRAGR